MEDWRREAACRGVPTAEYFTNDNGRVGVSPEVVARCSRCPVREECLEWAVAHEEYGFWGGTTARERARMRSRRGISLQPVRLFTLGRMERSEHRDSNGGLDS